jgi:hypothetical protein
MSIFLSCYQQLQLESASSLDLSRLLGFIIRDQHFCYFLGNNLFIGRLIGILQRNPSLILMPSDLPAL